MVTGNAYIRSIIDVRRVAASKPALSEAEGPKALGMAGARYATYAIRDKIIVQGIIDMLVQTPKGLLLIDFKTDRINAGQVSQRAVLYRKQLDLYGRAAAAILKEKLLAKWLYFLTPAIEFQIK